MNLQEALKAPTDAASAAWTDHRVICGISGKRSYPSKDAAIADATRHPEAWAGVKVITYRCDGCDGIHLSGTGR